MAVACSAGGRGRREALPAAGRPVAAQDAVVDDVTAAAAWHVVDAPQDACLGGPDAGERGPGGGIEDVGLELDSLAATPGEGGVERSQFGGAVESGPPGRGEKQGPPDLQPPFGLGQIAVGGAADDLVTTAVDDGEHNSSTVERVQDSVLHERVEIFRRRDARDKVPPDVRLVDDPRECLAIGDSYSPQLDHVVGQHKVGQRFPAHCASAPSAAGRLPAASTTTCASMTVPSL